VKPKEAWHLLRPSIVWHGDVRKVASYAEEMSLPGTGGLVFYGITVGWFGFGIIRRWKNVGRRRSRRGRGETR